jgi:orotate phosphoribosyltransferase
MAKVYIAEFSGTKVIEGRGAAGISSEPPLAEQTVAIGGTTAQSAAFNAGTNMIRVHTDAICSIAIGADPTATANTRRMAAGSTEYFGVTPGHKVAVITNT